LEGGGTEHDPGRERKLAQSEKNWSPRQETSRPTDREERSTGKPKKKVKKREKDPEGTGRPYEEKGGSKGKQSKTSAITGGLPQISPGKKTTREKGGRETNREEGQTMGAEPARDPSSARRRGDRDWVVTGARKVEKKRRETGGTG